MDLTIFVFFVLPLATILLAIVLQKILRSPILVAITFFAIYLIVAFVLFSDTLAEALIAVIIYTIIAYITAVIVMLIYRCRRRFCGNSDESSDLLTVDSSCFANSVNNVSTGADTTTDTSSLSDATLGTPKQYVNNSTMYGNIGRGSLSRRMYRRF